LIIEHIELGGSFLTLDPNRHEPRFKYEAIQFKSTTDSGWFYLNKLENLQRTEFGYTWKCGIFDVELKFIRIVNSLFKFRMIKYIFGFIPYNAYRGQIGITDKNKLISFIDNEKLQYIEIVE